MFHLIDNLLNKITMYRLMLYCLLMIAGLSVLGGLFDLLPFTATEFLLSGTILFLTCYGTNFLFAKLFNAPTNVESATITSLILFCVLTPVMNLHGGFTIMLAGVLAMASKYILAIHKKHLFNPTALAAFILGIIGSPAVSWWIATPVMLPLVALIGLVIVRKIRRFHLFLAFFLTTILAVAVLGKLADRPILDFISETITSWPILFLGMIMLTEPLTTPPTKKLQMVYGSIVGGLLNTPFVFGPIYSTPELALLVGNLFSYLVSPKQKLFLTLQSKTQIARDTYEFIFQSKQVPQFIPGQYLEWTLAHPHSDSRGNRRYFTIASSPTEQGIKLGVRFNEPSSSFKKNLLALTPQQTVVAAQLAGDFTLPKKQTEKLVFIAGGIGITPFRSMIKYLMDTKEKRDVVLLYANKTAEEIAYQDLFAQAQKQIGLKTVYLLSDKEHLPKNWTGRVGRIDEQMLQEEVPDYKDRIFYLSGPITMVDSYNYLLKKLGVGVFSPHRIVTDYFPGY